LAVWKEIDNEIYRLLSPNTKLHFNEILRQLKENNYKTNPETLSVHLNKMINQKILEREPYIKPGKKVYYWLSNKTKFEFDWNIFTGIKDVKLKKLTKEEREKERKKKLILFLLITASHGYTGYRRSLEFKAGNLLVLDSKGKPAGVTTYNEPGFSAKDLDVDDEFAHLSLGSNFLVLNRFNRDKIEDIIAELSKKDTYLKLREISSSDGKETRFDIPDETLKSFLNSCTTIIKYMLNMLRQKWFILLIKPQREEFEWFEFMIGEENAKVFFSNIEENKRQRRTIRERYIKFDPFNKIFGKEIVDKTIESIKNLQYQIEKGLEGEKLIKHLEAVNQGKFKLPDSYLEKSIKNNIRSMEQIMKIDFKDINNKSEYTELKIKYPWIISQIRDIIVPDTIKIHLNVNV
jgi:DNA-binding HxlR family transcriptional regulator